MCFLLPLINLRSDTKREAQLGIEAERAAGDRERVGWPPLRNSKQVKSDLIALSSPIADRAGNATLSFNFILFNKTFFNILLPPSHLPHMLVSIHIGI